MQLLLISLVLSLLMIYLLNAKYKYSVLICFLGFVITAYLFEPRIALNNYGYYTDLIRFFNELEFIKNMDWSQAFFSSVYPFNFNYSELWLNNIILLFCAKSNNYHILPLIVSIIFYGYLFITLDSVLKDCKYRKSLCALSIIAVYTFFNYTGVICNIRNPIAFLVGICTLYWDLVKEKNTMSCFVVYILIIFIHPVALIILALRLLAILLNKYTSKIFQVGLVIMVLFLPSIGEYIIDSRNAYIIGLAKRILAYGGGQEDLQNYGDTTLLLLSIYLGICYFITLLIMSFYCKETRYKKYTQIGYLVFFVCMASYFFNIHMFYRLNSLMAYNFVLVLPLAYHYMKRAYANNKSALLGIIYYIYSAMVCLLCLSKFYYYFGTLNYQMLNLGA